MVAVQFQVEGFRWQLWPLYGVALSMALETCWPGRAAGVLPPRPEGGSGIGGDHPGGGAGPGLCRWWTFPPPTGPYQVGTAGFEIRSPDRLEDYGPDTGEFRRLMVQFWYPGWPRPEHSR